MPDSVEASVTLDSENTSSWSIPISSGNLYKAIGQLRSDVMTYYASVKQNGQGSLEEEDIEGTFSACVTLPF